MGTAILFAEPAMTDDLGPEAAMDDHGDDTRSMLAVQAGDAEAMTPLVERFQGELVGFFYHHCWDQAQAEDLAQTVFIKVYQARVRYVPTARFRTWLYRIAHNALIDVIRKSRPGVSLDASTEDRSALRDTLAAPADTSRDSRDAEIRDRVRTALEKLPESQRSVFVMANSQGLKYQEIGAILGIPEGTVKSRMFAAVRTMRTLLADLVGGDDQ